MDIDLNGVIDLHVHTAPDIRPRKMDDLELASQAAQQGVRAILIKSHHTLTTDRAYVVQKVIPKIRLFGALVLNYPVGGLNVEAVDTAIKLGAKEIFMPTLSAENHYRFHGIRGPGITIFKANRLLPVVEEILRLIAENNLILGTGHLSVAETRALVKAAIKVGVKKILITHPELDLVDMSISEQKEIYQEGVFFERCFAQPREGTYELNIEENAQAIKEVGVESTIISTDLGQIENPSPPEGMRKYIEGLLEHGIREEKIEIMVKQNPASLLGI